MFFVLHLLYVSLPLSLSCRCTHKHNTTPHAKCRLMSDCLLCAMRAVGRWGGNARLFSRVARVASPTNPPPRSSHFACVVFTVRANTLGFHTRPLRDDNTRECPRHRNANMSAALALTVGVSACRRMCSMGLALIEIWRTRLTFLPCPNPSTTTTTPPPCTVRATTSPSLSLSTPFPHLAHPL